jgi:hypothetical protein
MFYNNRRVITNRPPLQVALSNLYQLYEHQNTFQEMHLDHQASLNTEYWDKFEGIMRNDLCPQITYFENTTRNCSDFISGTLNQGLHVIIVRYFETLRSTLNMYQNYTSLNDSAAINAMYNLDSLQETCK